MESVSTELLTAQVCNIFFLHMGTKFAIGGVSAPQAPSYLSKALKYQRGTEGKVFILC